MESHAIHKILESTHNSMQVVLYELDSLCDLQGGAEYSFAQENHNVCRIYMANMARFQLSRSEIKRILYTAKKPQQYHCASHRKNIITCAFGDTKLGFDMEIILQKDIQKAIDFAFRDEEKFIVQNSHNPKEMFYVIWTLKEAIIKLCDLKFSDIMRVGLDTNGARGFYKEKECDIAFYSAKWNMECADMHAESGAIFSVAYMKSYF